MSACRAVLPAELLLRTTGAWLPGPNGRAVVGVWCAAVAGTGCVPVWLSWLTVATYQQFNNQHCEQERHSASGWRVCGTAHASLPSGGSALFSVSIRLALLFVHTPTRSARTALGLREIELQTPFVILGDSQLLPQCLPRICSGVVTGFHHCAHQQPRRDGHMRSAKQQCHVHTYNQAATRPLVKLSTQAERYGRTGYRESKSYCLQPRRV